MGETHLVWAEYLLNTYSISGGGQKPPNPENNIETTNISKVKEQLNVTFPSHYHINSFSILCGIFFVKYYITLLYFINEDVEIKRN